MPPSPSASAPSPAPVLSIEGFRIAIPRLGIDLPIVDGDLLRDMPRVGHPGATPEGVALLLPGTPIPGDGGNSYIYAHARAGMFLALWNAHAGDVVVIRTSAGSTLRYVVTRVVPRVPLTDLTWLAQDGPERLTLQTSTGPNPGEPRFIVVAVRQQ